MTFNSATKVFILIGRILPHSMEPMVTPLQATTAGLELMLVETTMTVRSTADQQ